jgi:hypothetical protein
MRAVTAASNRLTAQGPLPGEDLLDGDQPLIQPIR